MNEQNWIDFENYLANEMSLEDRSTFEQKLQNDTSFLTEFNLYKETNGFLETKFSSETADFKNNLKSISNQHFNQENDKKGKIIRFNPKYFAIAASLVLFFGLYYFMQNQTPSYSDYNQHENAAFTERGDVIKNLKAAQVAFNANKFEEAIPFFESVLKEYPRPEIEYFYGVCLLECNRINKAESVFEKIKNGESVYKNKAIWSLALSKLKQKDYASCKEILLTIPSDYEDYAKVKKLLNEL